MGLCVRSCPCSYSTTLSKRLAVQYSTGYLKLGTHPFAVTLTDILLQDARVDATHTSNLAGSMDAVERASFHQLPPYDLLPYLNAWLYRPALTAWTALAPFTPVL